MEFTCDTHFITGQSVATHEQDRRTLMQALESQLYFLGITLDDIRRLPGYMSLCDGLRAQHEQFVHSIHGTKRSLSLKDSLRSGFTSALITGTIR
jgi:hypothetical protein